MPSLLDDPEAYAFAAQVAEDERKKLGLQSLLGGIGGLLEAPVSYVKERATALATDPIGDMKRTMQGTIDRAKQREQLQRIAYGDPTNPLRVTDQAAADQLAQDYLDMASTIMPVGMTVFHGSPYKFSAFDPTKIGSGEGAQAYGYGHYVAERPEIAKYYANILSEQRGKKLIDKSGNEISFPSADIDGLAEVYLRGSAGFDEARSQLKKLADDSPEYASSYNDAIKRLDDWESQGIRLGNDNPPQIYKIDLPDEQIANMLDWDKPISKQPAVMKALKSEAEQQVRDRLLVDVENEIKKGMPAPDLSGGYMDMFSEANIPLNKKVREQALEKINQMDLKPLVEKEFDSMKPPDMTWDMSGQDFYRLLSRRNGSPEKASDILRNQNVPGIRYLDQASRSPETGNATSNFVVFPKNEGLLKIEEVNGQPIQGGLLDTDYRGSHSAPNAEVYGATLDDLTKIMPANVYAPEGKQLYGLGDRLVDSEWRIAALKTRGKPDAEIEVYRAVPKGVKDINSGDWVTTSKTYADQHGERTLDGDYEIIKKKVKAKTLSSEGYPYEFGYNE